VLYCHQVQQWKLTDFGISATATSNRAHSTEYRRGTASYRAPEVWRHEFTNKVDIWSLGCVLHELATSKTAFEHDWAVHKFYETKDETLLIPVQSSSDFLQHHVSETIRELLNRDPLQRPRASTVSNLLYTYSQVFSLPDLHVFFLREGEVYPTYSEWKKEIFVDETPCNADMAAEGLKLRLTEYFSKNSERARAAGLLKAKKAFAAWAEGYLPHLRY
jgi:serine/threonine protein kinase